MNEGGVIEPWAFTVAARRAGRWGLSLAWTSITRRSPCRAPERRSERCRPTSWSSRRQPTSSPLPPLSRLRKTKPSDGREPRKRPPPHREPPDSAHSPKDRDRVYAQSMRAIAAGHPATADAGMEILDEGGSAADAAVAACLASCVAETVMTGLLGGGHAIHFDAASGRGRTSTSSSRYRDWGASGAT